MSRDLELVVDLTTSVLAGRRSAGMSRVERGVRGQPRHGTTTARCAASPGIRSATTSRPRKVRTPSWRWVAPSGSISRRVLLVTGGGWLSNPAYLHALGRYRDRLGAELVAVIHDVLPIIRPHWFPVRDAARNAAGIATMLAVADGVLVYSASTHDDLQERDVPAAPPAHPMPPDHPGRRGARAGRPGRAGLCDAAGRSPLRPLRQHAHLPQEPRVPVQRLAPPHRATRRSHCRASCWSAAPRQTRPRWPTGSDATPSWQGTCSRWTTSTMLDSPGSTSTACSRSTRRCTKDGACR